MKRFLLSVALIGLGTGTVAGTAWAEGGNDPDWPCIQRKQPHLSLGQVWTGPIPDDAANALAVDPAIAGFADRL